MIADALHRLRDISREWRASAMAAGQYSVECAPSQESEHAATAQALGKCADDLDAVLTTLRGDLPEVCTPELNAELNARLARDSALFEAGRQHGIKHGGTLRGAESEPPSLDDPSVQLLAWAVTNCHMLARRALARSTSLYDREKWEYVLRICEKAGARSAGVLRASLPSELTEGATDAARAPTPKGRS